jgi:hypothetical protein
MESTLTSLLNQLHVQAGSDGHEVTIETRTEHDGLNEVTEVDIAVHRPHRGREIAQASETCRETFIAHALHSAARRMMKDWQPEALPDGQPDENDTDGDDGDRPNTCMTDGCDRSVHFTLCRPCQRAWHDGRDHAQDRAEKRLQRLVRGGYDAE